MSITVSHPFDYMNAELAVFDTNVCLDLFVFHDPATETLLKAINENAIMAITREDCRTEWERVLDYPKLALSKTRIRQSRLEFDRFIHLVDLPKRDYRFLPLCSDTDDQKFLELAYDSRAKYLFTKDKALLKLARKNKKNGNFHIITPGQWKPGI